MSHIVNDCPGMKFPGRLSALHLADKEDTAWLGTQSTRQEELKFMTEPILPNKNSRTDSDDNSNN